MAKIYESRERAALNVALYPQARVPLDLRDVFYSLEDFKAYVRQDKNYAPAGYDEADIKFLKDIIPYSYAGQVVAVVSGDATTLYKIDKVGGDVEGVNYSAIGGDVAADLGALTGRVGTLETTVGAIPSTYQTRALPLIEGYASDTSTVEGALAEVMSKAMTNAGGITAVEGRVGKAEGSIKEMQSVLNAVSGTYATKAALDEVSVITIKKVDAKLANYYTSAQTDAKFETIANVNSKLENYYTSTQVDGKIDQVVKVAQGKTNSYVLKWFNNPSFESNEDVIQINLKDNPIRDYNGVTIPNTALKIGDIFYIIETNVPDRWLAGKISEDVYAFAKMETSKVDLKDYATETYVDEAVAGISDRLASYATISYVDEKVEEINGNIQAIEEWAASSISAADIEKWNKAEENAHNSAVASASAMVAEEAGVRESADNALSARIDAEESARISGDKALSDRIDTLPFDDYAKVDYVDAEISKVAAAATKVEKSNTNGNILVDGEEVVVYNDEALAERVTNAEASIGANAEAIASNAQHFTELQGTVVSIGTRVTNLETTVEGIPSTYATKEELSTEANTRAEEDGKLATRLSLVEESLGLRDPEDPEGGDNKGIAEQIAAIKAEIWGSAEMSASSRIDDIINSNPICTLSKSQESGHLVYEYMDESEGDVNLIDVIFGVESIASNAVALVSSQEIVSALDDLAHNHDAIKSTVQKAVTSVQTSTLVVSHSGNNLMINLPSVIWLDGGSASDTYEAEEAVYNELLNNEYGN